MTCNSLDRLDTLVNSDTYDLEYARKLVAMIPADLGAIVYRNPHLDRALGEVTRANTNYYSKLWARRVVELARKEVDNVQ